MGFHYDKNGVPVLSKDEIEKVADNVREWGGHDREDQTEQTDVLGIYKQLQCREELLFRYECLNKPSAGPKVLGKFCYGEPPVIILDEEHESSSSHVRTRFTLSHELGHFALHRHRIIRKQQELIDTDVDLPRNLGSQSESQNWEEWQANYFAGAILLPKKAIQKALMKFQRARGIQRNLGRIFLNDDSGSKIDFHASLDYLACLYSVSKTATEVRLRKLNLINDHRDDSSSSITNLNDLLS